MATKRRRKGGRKRRNTSAAVKQTRPAANKTANRNPAKPRTHRKGGFKRNSARRGWLPNGLSRLVSGIDLQTAAGVGGGVLAAKASDIVLPAREWSGIAAQGALALIIAFMAGKSKLGAGVAVGVAGVAIYNTANKLSNNAIDSFVLGNVARFRPVAALPAGNGQGAGMGALVNYPRRAGMGGLVNVKGEPVHAFV